MTDGTFVKAIEGITREAATPFFHTENDVPYTDTKLHVINPQTPLAMGVSTLTAVSTYCKRLLDEKGKYIIQIFDHKTVVLYSTLDDVFRVRERYIDAEIVHMPFQFDRDIGITDFIISLQSMFVQDEKTAEILKGVGNMSADAKITNKDDGVSQTVEARTGVAQAPENVKLPNPVMLRPFRTFPEVEQPVSRFVVRIKHSERHGFTVALHEADGGAWKVDAIASIKGWFEKELKELIKSGGITVLG